MIIDSTPDCAGNVSSARGAKYSSFLYGIERRLKKAKSVNRVCSFEPKMHP